VRNMTCCRTPSWRQAGQKTRAGSEPQGAQREDLALIANLPARDLPADTISRQRLPAVPLLAPSAGLLRRWYGADFHNQLRIIAEVDSIYYGLASLRSRLVHGALITTSAAARAAVEGRLPGGPGLRLIRLEPAFSPARSRSSPGSLPAKANVASITRNTRSTLRRQMTCGWPGTRSEASLAAGTAGVPDALQGYHWKGI
jgi:hypothetical protein